MIYSGGKHQIVSFRTWVKKYDWVKGLVNSETWLVVDLPL